MDPDDSWTSPSELAEYAFCPRSHFYRGRYGSTPASEAVEDGERYHSKVLGAERRRSERGSGYLALALAGVFLVVVAAVLFLRP